MFEFFETETYDKWAFFLSQKRLSPRDERVFAVTVWDSHSVIVNTCRGTISTLPDTIVHEIVHILLGYKWHSRRQQRTIEATVMKLTQSVLAVMSPLETWGLLKAFFDRAWWDE